jgi:hypothetical protein
VDYEPPRQLDQRREAARRLWNYNPTPELFYTISLGSCLPYGGALTPDALTK